MAKRKKVKLPLPIAIIAAAALIIYSLWSGDYLPFDIFGGADEAGGTAVSRSADISGSDAVHFVDCWQGDCEVIISDGRVTVIDCGPKKYSKQVVNYLKSVGVKRIDNLIFTHPHEDHIGGGASVINSFDIGEIYMVSPREGSEPTSDIYYSLLGAISDKGLRITAVNPGNKIDGGNFNLNVLAPLKEYDETNSNSIVIKAVYNKVSFLFTGDAESDSEGDMVSKYGAQLKCDVLKVGHHGSKTSSSKSFLSKAAPSYAVISCGENNSYSHPNGEVLKRLDNIGAEVYRTDLNGNIVISTDGDSVNIKTDRE